MFENLSDRLEKSFKILKGEGKITEINVAETLKDVRRALLDADSATYKKYLLVKREGERNVRRNIDHYNLDMIISLGYRVQSQVATRFRRWATELSTVC